MCVREDIGLSTNYRPLSVEILRDAKARKRILELTLKGVLIQPPKLLLHKGGIAVVHVRVIDGQLEGRPSRSFRIACEEDQKLRFLYFAKVIEEIAWHITCGGKRANCPDCSSQASFKWLGV